MILSPFILLIHNNCLYVFQYLPQDQCLRLKSNIWQNLKYFLILKGNYSYQLQKSELSHQNMQQTSSKKRQFQQQLKSLQLNDSTLPNIKRQGQNRQQRQEDLNDRLRRLQGNLKVLQKKYRENLKDGFENKIKAYRLQAVFQRKVMKNAIKVIQKQNQQKNIRQRWSVSQKKNSLFNSRVEAIKVDRYNRKQHFRQKKMVEKASFSLSLHENQAYLQKKAKESHDRILQQESLKDRKKEYFSTMKRTTLKKQQELLKQQFASRIYQNTEKLRSAQMTLQTLKNKYSRQDRSKVFLTL